MGNGTESDLHCALGSGMEVFGRGRSEGAGKTLPFSCGFLFAAEEKPVLAGFAADSQKHSGDLPERQSCAIEITLAQSFALTHYFRFCASFRAWGSAHLSIVLPT